MSPHLKKCLQQYLLAPSEFFITSKGPITLSRFTLSSKGYGERTNNGYWCLLYTLCVLWFTLCLCTIYSFWPIKKKRVKEQTIGISFNGIFLLQYIHKTINFLFTLNLCMLAHSCKKNKITYYLSSSIFSKHFS